MDFIDLLAQTPRFAGLDGAANLPEARSVRNVSDRIIFLKGDVHDDSFVAQIRSGDDTIVFTRCLLWHSAGHG